MIVLSYEIFSQGNLCCPIRSIQLHSEQEQRVFDLRVTVARQVFTVLQKAIFAIHLCV